MSAPAARVATARFGGDPRLGPIAAQMELNTDLVLNCLEGLSEADGAARLDGRSNSITFLAAHLADSRHLAAERLGGPRPNPLAEWLAGARSLDDLASLPTLAEVGDAWTQVSAHLRELWPTVSSALLEQATPQRFPGSDGTVLGMLAFLLQHESYHLGQIALIRRLRGHEAMSYRRRGT